MGLLHSEKDPVIFIMVGRIMASQRCPRLMPATCDYVTLHGKKETFAGMIKVKDLEVG